MWWWVPGGLFLAGSAGWILHSALAPFSQIWRGDTALVHALPAEAGHIKARNYLVYLMWLVPGAAGLLILGLAFAAAAIINEPNRLGVAVAWIGFALLIAAFPLTLIHFVVDLFNGPHFLIPPPYRGQRGSLAERRDRRDRVADGRPPTDHLVEIFDVSRLREPGEGYEPYITARCTAESCDWTAHLTRGRNDPSLPAAEVEELVRASARKHSTNVAAETVRPLDEVS